MILDFANEAVKGTSSESHWASDITATYRHRAKNSCLCYTPDRSIQTEIMYTERSVPLGCIDTIRFYPLHNKGPNLLHQASDIDTLTLSATMKFTAIAIAFLSQIALVLSGTYPARAEDVDACAALVRNDLLPLVAR